MILLTGKSSLVSVLAGLPVSGFQPKATLPLVETGKLTHLLTRSLAYPLTKKGFSMIELMITVVVIAICLILALRAFSVSAAAVSKAYNSMLALNILESKLDKLQEKAILEDGLEPSSSVEDIVVNNRKLTFTEEIIEWERPQEPSEPEEEKEKKLDLNLCQIELEVNWKSVGKARGLTVKTLIPLKGIRHKF